MHGTEGRAYTCSDTGLRVISFKLRVPALHKATVIDLWLAGRVSYSKRSESSVLALFVPKYIGKQGNIRQNIQTEGVFQATRGTCKDARILRLVNRGPLDLTFFAVFGIGQPFLASVLSGSVWTPSYDTTCPINFTYFWKSFRFAFLSLSKLFSSVCRASIKMVTGTMKSSKYSKHFSDCRLF